MRAEAADLIALDSDWQYLRGTAEASSPDPTAWRAVGFGDSSWSSGPAPFWYGEVQPTPGTELTDMPGQYGCVFLRQTFVVGNPGDVSELELGAQSDDGFIAWINGQEVARFNMPSGDVAFSDPSLPALPEPIPFQTFLLGNPAAFLVGGDNVLAVQAFNSSIGGSSDFVINVSLTASTDTFPPRMTDRIPAPGALVARLDRIEVVFDEAVTGVDADDLLINGMPAIELQPFAAFHYVFGFPEPPPGPVSVRWRSDHGIEDLASAPNAFAGGEWTYDLDPSFEPGGPVLNEFMADNDRTLNDAFGDDSDWVEIFNPTADAVSLAGWFLTDTTNNLAKWVFPPVTLPGGEYLLVFASGRDLTDPTQQLHTSFRLEKSRGYLALVGPRTNVVSDFYPGYPPQQTDVSYGRDQSNPNLLGYFPTPSPGGPNTAGGPGFAPEVVFSRAGGTFSSPFLLSLTPALAGSPAVIRYTLDGSPVTAFSPVYAAPLPISTTTQVRARAYENGLLPGTPATAAYVALQADVLSFTSDLPLMILHNNGAGTVPASSDQPVMVQTFEPVYGTSSLTNPPDLSSRAVFHKRGSSTLNYAKSSFFLETQDEVGWGRDVSLLGLPEESDWVLYAPNNFEPVLINNAVAHEVSRRMGQYSPRTRFVVVFLNTSGGAVSASHYNGIYLLEEKIKADRNRVDIDRLAPEHTRVPEVTGGYLLSVDRRDSGTQPFAAGGQPALNYLDPKYVEIITPQRSPQRQYIQQYLDEFYSVLMGPDWRDPNLGYAAYLDVLAALDHHIQGIVTFNVDALRLSGYLRKERNGKIVMGPVWDFDRTQGSTDGRDFNPRTWRSNVPDYGTDMFNSAGIYSNPWYTRLFRDIDFWQAWIDRYQELRDAALSDGAVHLIIEKMADQVRREQPREVNKWGVRPRSGTQSRDGFSHTFSGTYQGEVDWVKRWYSERLAFLDGNFLARPRLSLPEGPIVAGATVTVSGPAGATLYYTLDGSDPRAADGDLSPDARSYTGPISLTSNARLVARARDLNHSNLTGPNNPPLTTPWSGLSAATYVVATPALVISEIMYHPGPALDGSTNTADDFEFIELLNRGNTALNLLGAQFTNGLQYTFTPTSSVTQLAPGDRVVLVRNRSAFASRYPAVNNVAGEYIGSLENAGERVALIGPLREPIHDFRFDDAWYRATDGHGFSLVLVDESAPLASWPSAAAWRPSTALGGSPGLPDPPPPAIPRVVVNEALTHTDPPQVDSVELHNLETTPADVSGWWITDNRDEPDKFRIPPATVIEAGGYTLFTETEFTNNTASSFRLSSLGDEIFLFSTDGFTNLTGYAHGFGYGAARNGVSFGRHLTSQGHEHFVAQSQNTPMTANARPQVGPVVINEVMLHPPPFSGTNNNTRDEFVELRNLTTEFVELFDPNAATNGWRLRGGLDFDFAAPLTLPPGGYCLLVDFDPTLRPDVLAGFRSLYRLNASTLILGPYRGALDNSGERLGLYRPDPPQPAGSPQPGFVPYVLVDQLDYVTTAPWPTNVNATGNSLQRISPAAYGNDPANWEAATPTPAAPNPGEASVDRDGDGLPTQWEIDHGLDPDDPTGDHGADGDPDRDTVTNRHEWLSGTHPNNAGSYLKVKSVEADISGVRIRFMGVGGLTYTVLYRAAAASGPWQELQHVEPALSGEQVVPDPAGRLARRFYRLVTPKQN